MKQPILTAKGWFAGYQNKASVKAQLTKRSERVAGNVVSSQLQTHHMLVFLQSL